MSRTPCRVWDEGSRTAGAAALSFCRLFEQDVLKTSFRKDSDSPLVFLLESLQLLAAR
ncbi:MAG: hypothetical protein ABL924_11685 [Methyloglobulus sp.]